ncbi:hypothetical protein L3Y34_009681 [Caenorhabditis briggsae]|uniref:Uncharacterized protein n=1 Tax=Caenorhabditis briggsae TaxID=6238 RepID=A0AAE9D1U3_CAEBR|nr:hypothetical protein L3Y34_009681 [Caenorhabditis briggsae]
MILRVLNIGNIYISTKNSFQRSTILTGTKFEMYFFQISENFTLKPTYLFWGFLKITHMCNFPFINWQSN